MGKETKFISFFNQKGGVGKSTFEIIMATYCHNMLGLKVAILDSDFPQHNVLKLRENEIKLIQKSEVNQQIFARLGKPVFPVEGSEPASAVADLDNFLELEAGEEAFDIVFVDLPGTVNTPGVLSTIARLDHIFIPIVADQLVVTSSLEFGLVVAEKIIGQPNINLKSLHYFWNNVVKSEKSNLYGATEDTLKELDLPFLSHQIAQSVKFRKPEFRSTIFPMDRSLMKETNVVPLIHEILEIIGINVSSEIQTIE